MRALTLIFGILLLGGCVEADAAPLETSPPSSPPTDASLAPATAATAPASTSNESEATEVETEIDIDGHTPTVVCPIAFPVHGNCFQLIEGSDLTEILEFPGASQSMTASLSWEATSPLHETMGIGLLLVRGDQVEFQPTHYAEGSSPLQLDWDLTAFQGETLGVHVAGYVTAGSGNVHVDVSPGQPWDLSGTIVSLA